MSEIIGVDYKKYEPHLRLTLLEERLSEEFAKKHNILKEDMVIGLILGGADRWPKKLPTNLSLKLIQELYKTFKCKLILFGGPGEKQDNDFILSKSALVIVMRELDVL